MADQQDPINPRSGGMKFASLRETFRNAALAGVVLTPYGALHGLTFGRESLVEQGALIGGIFLALRVPYLREVPLFLTRAVLVPLLLRSRKDAPEDMKQMVTDMQAKTGSGKHVNIYTYDRGMTNNAVALGGDIYIGKKLVDTMDKDELKFVVGHELAHIEAQDMSERYLFWPPFVDSILTGFITLSMFYETALSGRSAQDVAMAGGMVTLAAAYYMAASGVRNYHSRLTEYRADANAIRMTENVPAALGALEQLSRNGGGNTHREPTKWETFKASHPIGEDRRRAIMAMGRHYPIKVTLE